MRQLFLFTAFGFLLASVTPAMAEVTGKTLFSSHCATCHLPEGKPTLAPPIFGVVDHVKSAHPEKDDFVDYILAWVANPQEDKSLMPGAIRKFGLMPAFPYTQTDVRLIAEYLYDGTEELPAWYIEHYKEEHGHAPDAQ